MNNAFALSRKPAPTGVSASAWLLRAGYAWPAASAQAPSPSGAAATPLRGLLDASRQARDAAPKRRAGTGRAIAPRAFSLTLAPPLPPATPPPPPLPPSPAPEPAAVEAPARAATPASAAAGRTGSASRPASGLGAAGTPVEGVPERAGSLLPRTTPPARRPASQARSWLARALRLTGCGLRLEGWP